MDVPSQAYRFFEFHCEQSLDVLLSNDQIYAMLCAALPEFADYAASHGNLARSSLFNSFIAECSRINYYLFTALSEAAAELSSAYQELCEFKVCEQLFSPVSQTSRSCFRSTEYLGMDASIISILSTEIIEPRPTSRPRRAVSVNVAMRKKCDIERVTQDLRSLRLREELRRVRKCISDSRAAQSVNAREIRTLYGYVSHGSNENVARISDEADTQIDCYMRYAALFRKQFRACQLELKSIANRLAADGVAIAATQLSKDQNANDIAATAYNYAFALINHTQNQCVSAAHHSELHITETCVEDNTECRRIQLENQALRFRIYSMRDRLVRASHLGFY